MLLTIYLRKLRNSEFIQFVTDLFSIFNKHNTQAIGIKDQLDPIATDLESMKTVQATMKSDANDTIKSIDDRRDDCITGIRTVIDGYTYHYDPNYSEAAQLLLEKIDSFGTSIARQNYPTETVSLNGIYDSFTKDEKLKKAVSLLNITSWADQMNADNTLFNQQFLNKVDEDSKQSNDKIVELRKSVMEKYATLRTHVNSHATLNTNESYKVIVDQLNTLIETYNGIIKRRGANNKGDSANTPENTDTTKK